MKSYRRAAWLSVLGITAAGAFVAAQSRVPGWPYGYLTPPTPAEAAPACDDRRPFSCARPAAPVPDDGILRKLADTDKTFTRNQAYFDYGPADWYPRDHPPMPDIVARGREKGSCGRDAHDRQTCRTGGSLHIASGDGVDRR